MFVALLGPVQNGNDELFFDNSHLLNSFCVRTVSRTSCCDVERWAWEGLARRIAANAGPASVL